MIHQVLRRPARRIASSITSGEGRLSAATVIVAWLMLASCSDPMEPPGTRPVGHVRLNPEIVGIGGGFDDAGNSGSAPGTLWFPTGWRFLPQFGDGANGLQNCLLYGRCNAGSLTIQLGTLTAPANSDPNPGPGGTTSTSFGYMSTSNFTRQDGPNEVNYTNRVSAIEQEHFFTPSSLETPFTGKGLYRLRFDYAFLTSADTPSPGLDPYALFQVLWDQNPPSVPGTPIAYERRDQVFRISRSDVATNPSLQQAGGCGSGGIGNATYSLCTGWHNVTVDIPPFYYDKRFVLRLLIQDGGDPYSEIDAFDRLIPDNAFGSVIAMDNFKILGLPLLTGAGPVPDGPVAINTLATLAATYEYADPLATHTGVFDWGDNSTSPAATTQSNGTGSFTGTHTYVSPGVYVVTPTVTDNAANSSSGETAIAVYDPNSSFVTGAGWILSPPNAYTPDPAMTGMAHFAFVSKIVKGAQGAPTGSTSFRFQAADFVFESTSYDWLVVAGSKAQFKGSGSINDAGDYAFMLTAVDGMITGGGGIDKFRIKIWNKATAAVIYDNQLGGSDAATPVTALGGGNISIKK